MQVTKNSPYNKCDNNAKFFNKPVDCDMFGGLSWTFPKTFVLETSIFFQSNEPAIKKVPLQARQNGLDQLCGVSSFYFFVA